MKTQLPCLVVLLACALAGPAPAAESAAARLQQGLFEEEANQHYDAAIAAYQSVLATHEEERRLAATALFRLGECYRKLGRTNEAVSHYQRLLHDFSDQSALTRLSEQHLAELGMPRDTTLPGGSSTPPALASNPAARALLEERIRLTEDQLSKAKETVERGLAATNSLLPYRQELARLRRELAATQEPPGGPDQQKWLREEISVVEQKLQQARELIAKGLAGKSSDTEVEKELLALKTNLVMMQAYAARPTDEGQSTFRQRLLEITERAAGTGEKREIERLQAMLQESPDLVNTSKQGEPPPLHKAVQSGTLEVADFLLNHGAEVDLRATDSSSP
ncbi:MAG TPA: tetratricopeptide repeat protein, partial [Candidatus Saccharimonadales bacterium]|nr:tetratricopeptide repeat protein [Candidatus Saccharimonadales bacterium]